MNAEKYEYLFLQVDQDLRNSVGGNNDIYPYHDSKTILFRQKDAFGIQAPTEDYQGSFEEWKSSKGIIDYTGKEYQWECHLPVDVIVEHNGPIHLEMSVLILNRVAQFEEAPLVILDHRDSKGNIIKYTSFPIYQIPESAPETWREEHYNIEIGHVEASDQMKIFIWNKGKEDLLLKEVDLKLWGLESGNQITNRQ